MTKHNEEETISEILKSHGLTGAPAERLEKHLKDWIRAECAIVRADLWDSFAVIDAIRKLEKRLVAATAASAASESEAS